MTQNLPPRRRVPRGAGPGAARHSSVRFAAFALAAGVLLLFLPDAAHATTSSGVPWSSGMNTLSNEAKGGLAFVFVVLGCVGGFTEYMNGGQLGLLLTALGRAGIVIGALGGIVTFASLFGMSSAVI